MGEAQVVADSDRLGLIDAEARFVRLLSDQPLWALALWALAPARMQDRTNRVGVQPFEMPYALITNFPMHFQPSPP